MARTMKQTAKAPLSPYRAAPGVRTARAANPPSQGTSRPGSSTPAGSPQSSWPIYEELVAELGDPTA